MFLDEHALTALQRTTTSTPVSRATSAGSCDFTARFPEGQAGFSEGIALPHVIHQSHHTTRHFSNEFSTAHPREL